MNPARDIDVAGIADTGWYKARIGSVELTYVHSKMTKESFDHFLAEACRSIDECGDDETLSLLVEVVEPVLMDSRWRKRLATALQERADKLRRTRPAYVMVTSSLVVRSALKVLHWAAPPPYAHAVVSTLEEAFDFLARHIPGLDARALQAEYERRRAAVLATLGRG